MDHYEELFLCIPTDKPFYTEDLFQKIDELNSRYEFYPADAVFSKPKNNFLRLKLKDKEVEKLYGIVKQMFKYLIQEKLITSHDDYYYTPLVGNE